MDGSELDNDQSLTAGIARTHDHTGVKALMLAVLEEAIRTYCEATGRAHAEAESWIWGRPRRSPFSFDVICDVLGLEPSAVRAALTRSAGIGARLRGNAGAGRHSVTPPNDFANS